MKTLALIAAAVILSSLLPRRGTWYGAFAQGFAVGAAVGLIAWAAS